MATKTDPEASSFQKRPCYRYVRDADRLPTYEELGEASFEQITVKVRLFNPTGIGTWWIAAYDPDTRIAWGAAELQEREVGSFSMEELVEFRGVFGLPIERDTYFEPKSLADVMSGTGR